MALLLSYFKKHIGSAPKEGLGCSSKGRARLQRKGLVIGAKEGLGGSRTSDRGCAAENFIPTELHVQLFWLLQNLLNFERTSN